MNVSNLFAFLFQNGVNVTKNHLRVNNCHNSVYKAFFFCMSVYFLYLWTNK